MRQSILYGMALVVISGCLSRKVYLLGTTERSVIPRNVVIAADGSVAIEGSVIRRRGSDSRYFYRDGDSMRFAMAYYNSRDPFLSGTLRLPGLIGKSDESWRMIPSKLNAGPVRLSDLPSQFSSIISSYPMKGQEIRYPLHGRVVNLRLDQMEGLGRDRALWSYPCQILLVPASAIDIAIYPFYLMYLIGYWWL